MNTKEAKAQTQEGQEPKNYLYKGINIQAFKYYFQQGWIAPFDPKNGWITNCPERAHKMAEAQRLGLFSTSPSPNYCLIVIDYEFVARNRLPVHQRYGTEYGHYCDFMGEARITWSDIKAVFTSAEGERQIETVAQEVKFEEWEEFRKKIIKIEEPILNQKPDFIDENLQLNRRRLI